MKLTSEQIKKIKESWGDWEGVHSKYDQIVEERLRELDQEFMEDLDKVITGATFWYA